MAIVETRYGKVEGYSSNGIQGFRGIPFAAPPVGERRWMPPEPPESWAGVRDAKDWGKQAWQAASPGEGPLKFVFNAANAEKRDEDCLQLNVWTPGLDDAKRPVLMWIHGGGFSGGTGGTPVYDGEIMSRRGDVVVVTINYRIGPLGFLNLNGVTGGRIPSTGNEGLLDQVEALKWIRDNIATFGGDPGNVTIMGESAGAMSVGALLAFAPAKGLIHRAMPISGAASTANTLERAEAIGEGIVQQLGLSGNDVDKLLALEPEALLQGAMGFRLPEGGMSFAPVIDGNQLAELPLDAIRGGAADGIPVLVGTQRDEWRLFVCRGALAADLDEARLVTEVSKVVEDAQGVIEGYRQILGGRGHPTDVVSILAAIETGRKMRIPSIELAEAMAARGQPAWQYVFTHESPWDGGYLMASHAIFIGFLFGTHDYSGESAEFFGRGEAADALSGHLQDAVINLARNGNPRTDALADWVPYDTQTRSTAVFGHPVEVASAPFDEERLLWANHPVGLPFGPDRQ
ncbi:MAG: carboxylesterase family protein [Gammaproteobacteria bacterium]|nr:carboxylesterase family protein [Gammaproteobacteria bacterium]